MLKFTQEEIAEITGGKLLSDKNGIEIRNFSIDSRTVKDKDFFIAVKGSNFDGHDFVLDAIKKGASGLMVERFTWEHLPQGVDCVIIVDDARRAMGRIAGEIRKRSSAKIVAITGTNGKTTVKDILSYILSFGYKVLRSKKSYNNIIGLSLTLFDLEEEDDIAVLELGTNHPGEIAALAKIANPDIALITNIGSGHLEHFGSREGVLTEKVSLLDFLPEGGLALLNRDDSLLAATGGRSGTGKFYGTHPGCDFRISSIMKKERGYEFLFNGERFFLPLEGIHNVYNASSALAVAMCLGMETGIMREALRGVTLPEMRLERINMNGITFINDSYNANPDSFECALEVLKETISPRRGVIAGEMMELGGATDELHRTVGRSIAVKGIDFVISLGEMSRGILRGALEYGMDERNTYFAKDHEDAARMLQRLAGAKAAVLLKGSRKTKMEEVLKCFTTCCTH